MNPFEKSAPDRVARIAGAVLVALLLLLVTLRGTWVAGHLRALAPMGGGDAAPAFKLPLLGGGEFALGPGDGKVTVLDFFATWCEPCREALPHVDALAARYQARGVRFVAVDVEDESAHKTVEWLAAQLRLKLPIALDGDDVSALYKINTLPTTVIVGRDGSVARVLIGVHSEEELSRFIDRALDQ